MTCATKQTLLAAALLLGAVTTSSSPALAWGKTGHRVSGAIAERHLSGIARAKISILLGDETLADASVWADEMRSNPAPFWQKTASPWHYVTVPGHHYQHVHAPDEGDAVTALRRFEAIIRSSTSSLEEKQLALRFIIHIVGDLHQPLHAGKPGDRGGNDVKVTFFGRDTNLHSVWDYGLVDQEQLSFSEMTEKLMRETTSEEVVRWWNSDPSIWVSESAQIRDTIYPTDPKLSYDYVYRNKPILDQRLQQAGIRLAAYLNELFRSLPVKA